MISLLPAKNGRNLILPLGEATAQAAAEIIDREAAQGNILYEGFMNCNTIKKYSDRITILPSYVLLIQGIGKITAIPRDKIYWIGAQQGHKGGPYYVRLLILTEKTLIGFDGNDVEHTRKIAENIYQYIPNVFEDLEEYSTPYFPDALEKLYTEDRAGFLAFYEYARKSGKPPRPNGEESI